eukprot:2731006-Prymnesium_polylepis.1
MRENAINESGQYAENSSSGGIKFHLSIKSEMLQVPDMISFNMRTSEGVSREIIVNRYENVFVADEKYTSAAAGGSWAPTATTLRRAGRRPAAQEEATEDAGLAQQHAIGRGGRGGRVRGGRVRAARSREGCT